MATMSDWAKDLDDMLADCLNGSEETDRPRRWRYSGFFDWFSDQKKPGFLPDFGIDGGSPLKIGSGHPLGLDTGSYNVNARSIFIGLNPTFPKNLR